MDTKIYELVITGTNKENYVLKFLVRSLVEDEIKSHETNAIEILKKAKKKVLEGIISDEPIQGALIK
ncbi:MAG: hypothetical protein K9J84_12415 [Bacteroidia bacterium]|nr:hypothetical protein [Bacteroidia bacterium]